MANGCGEWNKPNFGIFHANGRIRVSIGNYVFVQYMGGNEGGRSGDCKMQEFPISQVQERIGRVVFVYVYIGSCFFSDGKMWR